MSVRNRLMSSIAAECEPRLCARCVEQWRATRSPVAGTARYIRRVDIGGRSVRRREASVAFNPPVECRTDISRKSQVISGKKNDTFVIRAKRTARTPTPRRALALPPRVFGGLTNMPFPTESPTRSTRRVHRGPRCGKMSNILVLVFLVETRWPEPTHIPPPCIAWTSCARDPATPHRARARGAT